MRKAANRIHQSLLATQGLCHSAEATVQVRTHESGEGSTAPSSESRLQLPTSSPLFGLYFGPKLISYLSQEDFKG